MNVQIWGMYISGGGNGKGKAPEVGKELDMLKEHKEVHC